MHGFQHEDGRQNDQAEPAQMTSQEDQRLFAQAEVALPQTPGNADVLEEAKDEQRGRQGEQSRRQSVNEVVGIAGGQTPVDQQQHGRPGRRQQNG